MSDTTEQATETGDNGFNPITSQADLDKIVSARIAREREKYSDYKDLRAKAARLDELEEANKTELEKANARASSAEEKLKAYEHAEKVRGWKAEVAQETGVPVEALAGNTLDEIQAHGQTLANIFGNQKQDASAQKVIVRSEGENHLPLNGDGIENALRNALGIS